MKNIYLSIIMTVLKTLSCTSNNVTSHLLLFSDISYWDKIEKPGHQLICITSCLKSTDILQKRVRIFFFFKNILCYYNSQFICLILYAFFLHISMYSLIFKFHHCCSVAILLSMYILSY